MKVLLILLLLGCYNPRLISSHDQFSMALVGHGKINHQNVQVVCISFMNAGQIDKVLLYNRDSGLYMGRFEWSNGWYWFPNSGLWKHVKRGQEVDVSVVEEFLKVQHGKHDMSE